MENFVIGIPSYQRADKQITLDYLAGLGIPQSRIHIFVQTEGDAKAYEKYRDRACIVYAQANGIAKARNNILRTLLQTANVLMMDDDISGVSRLRKGKLAPIETREEFADTFNRCFAMTAKSGSGLFGIYPVHNAFFMSAAISTAVTVNTVLGFTQGCGLTFDGSYKAKEDIELCARVLAGGGKVYRFNFLAPNAKHRTNAGGCHDAWHSDENRKAVERLTTAYPGILAPHASKPDEVRVVLRDEGKIALKKGS